MNENGELNKYKKQLEIMDEKYNIANKWIYLLSNDKPLTENLNRNNINQIIIYGASEFAVRLIEQCKRENFAIMAITDKKIKHRGGFYREIPLITADELEKIDLLHTYVVITAMGFYNEIKDELAQRNIKNVISLCELIEDALTSVRW
jgi:FlaA1/EpsC-like NDP-sugar epimerase